MSSCYDPLPLTVISGYLGAGKTTLINRLLAENHHCRLMILVNDFGSINIDAQLLVSADEDTIALTNGCVCCTMGADLFMAIDDVLKRNPRPEHLIVEASGIANPAQIAQVAITEPELRYGGIVTVVDAVNYPKQADDPLIGVQIREQLSKADLIVINKHQQNEQLHRQLARENAGQVLNLHSIKALAPLLLDIRIAQNSAKQTTNHPDYVSWSYSGDITMTYDHITSLLEKRPKGLYRLKGFIREDNNICWQVQTVGNLVDITASNHQSHSVLIGIGIKDVINKETIIQWWADE